MTWGPDPELTPLGEDQAREVNAAWKTQIERLDKGLDAAPLPTRLFSSPFKRSAMTLLLTYEGILLPPGTTPSISKQVTPVSAPYVKEDLREQYGDDHEAVHRSSKSTIQKSFPDYEIEKSFTEQDERFKVSGTAPPVILEGLRENYRDEHTCDERSTKSQVAAYTPGWSIEEGFAEKDERFGVSSQLGERQHGLWRQCSRSTDVACP
jgi:broad specificity phosphatase PhoE